MFGPKTQCVVVVGAQWGDEGKGKIVDVLAERADLVVRYQGGANAGHTVHTAAGEFVLHQIPSGIIQGAVCLVGNGVVLDPETLFTELDALPPAAGVGVIFPDLEEYGLVGARALVRERAHLFSDTAVVNLDGLDDRGRTIALVHRGGSLVDRLARALGARRARWLPILVDGAVLARAAREAVTVVRGDWTTAQTVHSPRDAASRLTLSGARDVARALVESLTPP